VVQRAHGGRDTLRNVVLDCSACNCKRNAPRGMRHPMAKAQPKKTKKAAPKKPAAKTKAPKRAAKRAVKPLANAKPRKAPAPNPSVGGDVTIDD
jgi:hypothetical protein